MGKGQKRPLAVIAKITATKRKRLVRNRVANEIVGLVLAHRLTKATKVARENADLFIVNQEPA